MPHELLQSLSDAGVIATVRAPSPEAAIAACRAIVPAGVTALEITYTTPDAARVIAALAEEFGDTVILGAGTLTAAEQAIEALEAGAGFLVSPGYDPEVYRAMRDGGALTMVGGFTPTEVMTLARESVDVVKFFPGSIGGPSALRALRGPFPGLAYIPTGGVAPSNLADWLAAGAIAVGAGSELLPAAAVATGDVAALRAGAESFMAALTAARG